VSSALYDSIVRIARHEAGARAFTGVGKVVNAYPAPDGANPPDYAVSVEMRDTGLVLPRVPVVVGAMGFAAIPAVDDLVVVLFLEGDYNAPIVVGSLYHPDQNPPKHEEGQLVLRLPSGSSEPKLEAEINGSEPSVTLKIGDDVSIAVGKDKVQIKVGDMQVSLETSGGGRAEIAAGGSVITLKKDGDVAINSKGKLEMKANEIEINGTAKVKISGAQMEIN
jgi:hypothetical protein